MRRKRDKKYSVFFSVLTVLFLIGIGMLLALIISPYNFNNLVTGSLTDNDISESEQEIINKCEGQNIFNTAGCLNNEINKVFSYKVRPDSETPDFDELVEEGGDCRNWANLYIRLGNEMGFNTKFHSVKIEENLDHAYATLSNAEGWCVMDGRNYKCYKFKEVENVE